MKVLILLVLSFCTAFAGGGSGPVSVPARLPASLPAPCAALHLPPTWDVRSGAYADVTGDGLPECVLALWRPWADWPIRRWSQAQTPIGANRDAAGDSAHIAVLRPLAGGAYQKVWIGSALFRPVLALSVEPGGRLRTWEGTYAAGRSSPSVALSEWTWTGFGFQLERRLERRMPPLGPPIYTPGATGGDSGGGSAAASAGSLR
ncbi:hypothetical protein [Deinococcus puniceus]|uniref:hypothetical protein n=1 Tax=Deinococcus puniceus TaxID=1182568 RepID=UPI000A5E8194|nr:hypothetical protein [Deinococcus puniceus]